MAAQVEIIIDPRTGKAVFEINGVQGSSCTDITEQLVANREVEDEGFTEEYHYETGLPNYAKDGF